MGEGSSWSSGTKLSCEELGLGVFSASMVTSGLPRQRNIDGGGFRGHKTRRIMDGRSGGDGVEFSAPTLKLLFWSEPQIGQ
jgi:hypothetical protein